MEYQTKLARGGIDINVIVKLTKDGDGWLCYDKFAEVNETLDQDGLTVTDPEYAIFKDGDRLTLTAKEMKKFEELCGEENGPFLPAGAYPFSSEEAADGWRYR